MMWVAHPANIADRHERSMRRRSARQAPRKSAVPESQRILRLRSVHAALGTYWLASHTRPETLPPFSARNTSTARTW